MSLHSVLYPVSVPFPFGARRAGLHIPMVMPSYARCLFVVKPRMELSKEFLWAGRGTEAERKKLGTSVDLARLTETL